jgi:hypothetical protein
MGLWMNFQWLPRFQRCDWCLQRRWPLGWGTLFTFFDGGPAASSRRGQWLDMARLQGLGVGDVRGDDGGQMVKIGQTHFSSVCRSVDEGD